MHRCCSAAAMRAATLVLQQSSPATYFLVTAKKVDSSRRRIHDTHHNDGRAPWLGWFGFLNLDHEHKSWCMEQRASVGSLYIFMDLMTISTPTKSPCVNGHQSRRCPKILGACRGEGVSSNKSESKCGAKSSEMKSSRR